MNRKNLEFYDADTGGSSGSGTDGGDSFSTTAADVFTSSNGAGEGDDKAGANDATSVASSTGGSGDSGNAGASGQAAQLTPEQITAAVREGVRQPEAPKQYTQDQLDEMFKVWKPNEEFVNKLLAGGQEALQAVTMMREGLAGQFGTLVKYQLEVLKKELQDQYAPALTFAQQAKAEKDREEFYKENEDLRPHTALVDIAYKSLIGEGKTFPTLKEAQKALADRAKQLIPNGSSGTTQSDGARTTTTATKPRPASLSTGSQAGGNSGGSAPPNVFHEIFGAR